LTEYLSTDELLGLIKKQSEISTYNFKKKAKFKINRKHIFWFAVVLAIFHILSQSITFFSENRGINTLGYTTVLAVPMDQELDDELTATVARIKKLDLEALMIGDKVIIYGKYGSDFYWIEEVIAINIGSNEITTTFDGLLANTVSIDEIEGVYIEDANFIQLLSYISTNTRGYIILILTYALVLSAVYFLYVNKKPKNKPLIS
jgi:hypothetical protein